MFPFLEVLQVLTPLLQGHHTDPHTQAAQQIVTAAAPLAAIPPTDQTALVAHQQAQIDTLTRMVQLMIQARQVAGVLPPTPAP